ncbi:DJ-1 family [Cryptosporidium sp. chipmunk genotype I]|uniref:DJ-1 family n=1 Tax=Cryptosporidium sp. chipmunk genotype I TaxID=1280935 RepID=UPI00351A08D6|nr:DJ-1 family [Cryptosporidium sp. chipmunk genotype I]
MSKKVLVALASGFEEIEFVAPVDILRRAGLNVTIAVSGNCNKAVGAHGITIVGDKLLDEVLSEDYDLVICPGGMDCAVKLGKDQNLLKILRETKKRGGIIASICASPVIVFEKNGLLSDVEKAVTYPSMMSELCRPDNSNAAVCVSSNVVTSQGPGTSVLFGLKLVEMLCGVEKSKLIADSILVT